VYCIPLSSILFLQEHIKPYVTSITSMDTTHILQTVRDTRGSHVIEAFLCSGAPGKHKRRLVTKYDYAFQLDFLYFYSVKFFYYFIGFIFKFSITDT
jgi:hypothetical protein